VKHTLATPPHSPRYCVSLPFEAARQIDEAPAHHRLRHLHGHSFLATVRCTPTPGFAPYAGAELDTVQTQWRAQLEQLDYRLLNAQIASPTDLNIAHWLQTHCTLPGVHRVELQSTPQAGVELDHDGSARAWRRYALQSAHKLPNVPAGHKCGNMHGHGFEVILHAEIGPKDDITDGMDLQDAPDACYALLDACWAPLHEEMDHACLNDLPGLENPTSEIMSSWIWSRLKPTLPTLQKVTVFETASCGAVYDGTHYQIWKDVTMDSALRLKAAPAGSKHSKLHGHTYTLRLHLSAPLDQVMGWTVDFGDVKEIFNPVFKMLDHKPLHEIPDLNDCDVATIASWILNKARTQLPQLCGVELFETQGCGVRVSSA
jgi:6-pyruvoyltetrahydropterin/6-carboxytetrahydropterin synthase